MSDAVSKPTGLPKCAACLAEVRGIWQQPHPPYTPGTCTFHCLACKAELVITHV